VEAPETDIVYRGDLGRLMVKVRADRGLDLSQYRRTYVERRLAARMRVLNVHSYRQYARCLDDDPEEYARLLDTLTINVTDFFRDPTVYQIVRRQVLPALIQEKAASRTRTIRAWSAGCASGEEPYSIAMAIAAALEDRGEHLAFTVFGTDLDPTVLETARRATYDVARLTGIPRADQARFVDAGPEKFTIKPELAERVQFRRLNLFEDRPIQLVDLIFCRNVFIYFTREQQERVLEGFLEALAPGGYLVLGRSEKMAASLTRRFELVNGRERIYRKPYNDKAAGA
jgi:chemotaxis methyl-accepting protein methylase